MKQRLLAVVDRLSRVGGVRGALVADTGAGVPVVQLTSDVDGATLAALGSSLFRRAERASEAAGLGAPVAIQLEAEGGHVLAAAGAGDLLLLAVAAPDAQLGMVRVESRRAAAELA